MNGKVIFMLAVMLTLMYVSRETDHAREITGAAGAAVRVMDEELTPERIGWTLGQKNGLIVRTANRGPDKTAYEYTFNETRLAMSLTFRFEDGKISQARGEARFDLKRGIPYELLEKIYVDALSDFFRSEPRRATDDSFEDPRRIFIWNAELSDGRPYEADLSIIRKRRRVHRNIQTLRYIWAKQDEVDVFLTVTPARHHQSGL